MCMLVLQLAQQQANLEETNAKKQSELIGANCLPPLLCYVRLTRALWLFDDPWGCAFVDFVR